MKPAEHLEVPLTQEYFPEAAVRAAASLQLVLAETRAAGIVQGLDVAGVTALLLNSHGLLVGASNAAKRLLLRERYLTLSDGRLEASAEAERRFFETRLAVVFASMQSGVPLSDCSLVLWCRDARSCISVEFLQLPREPLHFDSCAVVLLHIKPVSDERLRMEALMRDFQLTEAEAMVTLLLASGSSPACIAGRRRVSIATIRSHVKAVYAKLDIHRQSELLKVITALTLDWEDGADGCRAAVTRCDHNHARRAASK